MTNKLPKVHPWDEACKRTVIRENLPVFPAADLEPGVKFFVLMLEKLGCKTLFSCEGHPAGFYILFECTDLSLVRRMADGEFDVEVDRREYTYRLSLAHYQLAAGRAWSISARDKVLKRIARNWCEKFGALPKESKHVLPVVRVPTDSGTRQGAQV